MTLRHKLAEAAIAERATLIAWEEAIAETRAELAQKAWSQGLVTHLTAVADFELMRHPRVVAAVKARQAAADARDLADAEVMAAWDARIDAQTAEMRTQTEAFTRMADAIVKRAQW
jgi:hypothetical protein